MKRILVPSDLSNLAEEGLKMAVKLAIKLNAEVHIVNFFEPYSSSGSFLKTGRLPARNTSIDFGYGGEIVKMNKSKLALLASHYAQQGVSLKYEIINRRLKDGIVPYIIENDIDLVVIGISGDKLGEEKFTVNHAEQVSEKVSCPVITVATANGIDLDAIVIALDKKSLGYLDLFKESLKEIAEQLCEKAHILCIINPTDKIRPEEINKVKSFANSFDKIGSRYHLVFDEDKERPLIEFAKRKKAGIISVFVGVKNGFVEIINNRFSKNILKRTNIPVLNINRDTDR